MKKKILPIPLILLIPIVMLVVVIVAGIYRFKQVTKRSWRSFILHKSIMTSCWKLFDLKDVPMDN